MDPTTPELIHRLRRSLLSLARQLRPTAPGDGLSPAKLSVIGHLHRSGPLSPTELAARERVRPPSLTRLLAELESDGWLSRQAHATDGRRTLLALTATGRRRLQAAAQATHAPLAEALATALGPNGRAELERTCDLLERIDALLSPARLETPSPPRRPRR